MPRPPPPLLDELVEEVLLRLPPENPEGLVRAGLVCKRWCRIVSDPGFRRRFCEFHRSPPMLGMLYNLDVAHEYRLVATMAFCFPHANRQDWRVLDAHHGHVLCEKGSSGVFVVWEPITDEVREFPFPEEIVGPWTAAVVCSAAGACHHLCHHGPFLIVFVSTSHNGTAFVRTYSSDAAAWSGPVFAQQNFLAKFFGVSAHVGNSVYFGNGMESSALKYDLELCQLSLIQLPYVPRRTLWEPLLTTTEDGGLCVVYKDDSKIYMCSWKDTPELGAYWERRFIRLKKVFPVDVDVGELGVIGYGVGLIFVRTREEVYTIDRKTHEVKKVFQGMPCKVIPYMSFYTPALKGTCTAEGSNACNSSA